MSCPISTCEILKDYWICIDVVLVDLSLVGKELRLIFEKFIVLLRLCEESPISFRFGFRFLLKIKENIFDVPFNLNSQDSPVTNCKKVRCITELFESCYSNYIKSPSIDITEQIGAFLFLFILTGPISMIDINSSFFQERFQANCNTSIY